LTDTAKRRWLTASVLILGAFAVVYTTDFDHFLTLEALKRHQAEINGWLMHDPVETTIVFFLSYTLFTATSLPGAILFTLAGGAIFGLVWGTIVVSLASTIGATLAFLVARFLFRRTIREQFHDRFRRIRDGFEKDGPFYLFSLRLVPVFPFFLINVLMGLTNIRTPTYFVVSQVGMLPATIIYVNAGTELSRISTMQEILSPRVIVSLALLGLFPIGARLIVRALRRAREQV
jgi:uncharacterized membrane protein YdjX (TVP38/TMEM64 family)